MKVTQNDVHMQFHNETGLTFENFPIIYWNWLEETYIEKLNEEKELNASLEELFLSNVTDGE